MGVTQLSLDRLTRFDCLRKGIIMLELGAQNIYSTENYGSIAKDIFSALGVEHTSIDITPHQGALAMDLREPETLNHRYNVITNFGTMEHMDGGLYMGFKNVHNLCESDGLMIHENPKTGNWIGHGQHYFTKEFYVELANLCKYELLEVTEEAAMGNVTDGWNVCAVLRKTKDSKFITEAQFAKLDVRKS